MAQVEAGGTAGGARGRGRTWPGKTRQAISPTSTPAIFLSHTTRDHRDFALAHRLASALALRGARVWIAPESIPPGDRWEKAIVEAVMRDATHFLVILSAASTQADWVMHEITLARQRQARDASFVVLPLEMGTLPEYAERAFVSRFQKVPYHDDLAGQLEAVAAALGLRPAAQAVLPPGAASAEEFVGRQYVFDAIEAFQRREKSGYFVLSGDPGAGKTAIMAEYVRRSGCSAHFNVRSLGVNTARQFLESICAQLIARYGLPYPSLPPDATQDGNFLATTLLPEARGQLSEGEPLVVAVDALDEVDLTGQRDGANVLYLPGRLPDRTYVVASRRDADVPLTVNTPLEVYDLEDHLDETKVDAGTYIGRAAARRGIRMWMGRRGLTDQEFVAALVSRSEGNFMYLRHVLMDIERGRFDDLMTADLPQGLQGYYEDHWRRMGMMARPLPMVKIRIVYVLAEARGPVSRSFISQLASDAALSIDELTVQDVLDEWDQFLHDQVVGGVRRYSLYHASFRDFLRRRDIVQASGVSVQSINDVMQDALWRELFDDQQPS